MIRVGVTKEIT